MDDATKLGNKEQTVTHIGRNGRTQSPVLQPGVQLLSTARELRGCKARHPIGHQPREGDA